MGTFSKSYLKPKWNMGFNRVSCRCQISHQRGLQKNGEILKLWGQGSFLGLKLSSFSMVKNGAQWWPIRWEMIRGRCQGLGRWHVRAFKMDFRPCWIPGSLLEFQPWHFVCVGDGKVARQSLGRSDTHTWPLVPKSHNIWWGDRWGSYYTHRDVYMKAYCSLWTYFYWLA